jgi:P27 family predicted phage terminase small subunit
MAGRRPKPTVLKELAGNPGHRPLNDSEPKPQLVAPEMPKGMARAARREWSRIVPALLQLGVLSNIDGKALAAYCDAYSMWEEARKDLHKNGLVQDTPVLDKESKPVFIDGGDYQGEDGTRMVLMVRKKNPAFEIYNSSAKLMKSFLIEFGLTPASRSKLKIEKKADADPMAKFLGEEQQAAKDAAPLMFRTGKPDYAANIPSSLTDFEA